MEYRRTVVTTMRRGYENLGGLVVLSLGTTLSLAPIAVASIVGTPLVALAALWATSLLLGLVLVAASRFTTTVAARGVSVDLRPTVTPAVRNPVPGLELGTATFGVLLVAGGSSILAPVAYRSVGVGFAVFTLVLWYLLVAFATPELGANRRLVPALRASSIRLIESPVSATVFLALTLVCTIVTGVTVVTMGLLLPGALSLLAAQMAAAVDDHLNQQR